MTKKDAIRIIDNAILSLERALDYNLSWKDIDRMRKTQDELYRLKQSIKK